MRRHVMSRTKRKTFSSTREIFKTYLPKNTQGRKGNIEDQRTNELLEHFKSSLEKKTRR